MVPIRVAAGSVTFAVRVHPRAKKDAITGTHADALKVSLTAPPADGRANAALVAFLAQVLRLPRSSVTIATGQGSRSKLVRVTGISATALQQRLEQLLAGE